jgi:hypothetical protein
MRAVLDTNILARAAASPSGLAGELFERISTGHALLVSMDDVQLLSLLGSVAMEQNGQPPDLPTD